MCAYKRQSPQPVIEGGTGIQSATPYTPICGGTTSTGPFQVASSGQSNSGYVLTSTGASALPTWQPGSGGGPSGSFILLSTQTASSSSSIIFNNAFINSTYTSYFVLFNNVVNSTSGASFVMDWSTNNGSTYITGSYNSGVNYFFKTNSFFSNVNSTSTSLLTNSLGSANDVMFGNIFLQIPSSAAVPLCTGNLTNTDSNTFIISSSYSSNIVVNTIKFSFSAGTIVSGKISLYGIKQ